MDIEYITVQVYKVLNGWTLSVGWRESKEDCSYEWHRSRAYLALGEAPESIQSFLERIAEELYNVAPSAEQTDLVAGLSASGGLPEPTAFLD